MASTCRCCRLPSALKALVADQHRRNVPLRTIAANLAELGESVHRDAIWRHCRDHVAPADLHDIEHTPANTAAGLTVAAAVAGIMERWPSMAAEASAALRAEGLYAAADLLLATTPATRRAALVAAAGTPASEVLEARALVRALRKVLGSGHPEVSREVAAVLRDLGADDLADALDDLAASVESSDDPEERAREVQVRALRDALSHDGKDDHRRAFNGYCRMYGAPSPALLDAAAALTAPAGGGESSTAGTARREPTTTKESA